MKRTEVLKHLRGHGCEFIREGHRHFWWGNAGLNKRSPIPRHTEIDDSLAKKYVKTFLSSERNGITARK